VVARRSAGGPRGVADGVVVAAANSQASSSSIELSKNPDGSVSMSSPQCTGGVAVLRYRGKLRVMLTIAGSGRAEHAAALISALEDYRLSESFSLWADLEKLGTFDSKFRQVWTDWVRRQRESGRFEHVYVLFSSGMVALAVQIVTSAVGLPRTVWSKRADYEAALKA
jgi:hypothetical protein